MTDKARKYLSDILISINHIQSFTDEILTIDEYKNNFLVKAAVERHLAIVGEAVKKFLNDSADNHLTNASHIISLRNRLIHAYDNVDDRIIWAIVKKHIAPLKKEAEGLLSL